MREVKFRVWVKPWKWMDFPTSISIDDSGHIEGVRGYGGDYPYTDIELMQFTGLHDKNGREIYESDILRVERNDDPNDFYIAPVSWCGGDYPAFDILPKYWPHRVNYDTNALSAIYAGWSEEVMTVIGNIHEDPDLLEASK